MSCECRSSRTCAGCLNSKAPVSPSEDKQVSTIPGSPSDPSSAADGASGGLGGPSGGVVTPSGIEIAFEAEPKRRYLLRRRHDFDRPQNAWQEVPSVTEILGALDKPALPWWGMKVGVEGVLALWQQEFLREDEDGAMWLAHNTKDWEPPTVENVVKLLTAQKLTVNHQRDKAGARGVSVHDGLEQWAFLGRKPDPSDYPAEEFGYVAALRTLLDTIPFEPEAAEVMVGSLEHGYAGRFDLRAKLGQETEVQINSRRKVVLPKGTYLADLKSSKGIYPSHALQLAAYEAASVECGYEPTDFRLVIQVGAEGKFDLKFSKATTEDFLAVLDVHKTMNKKLLA